jgi:hypothetical protein
MFASLLGLENGSDGQLGHLRHKAILHENGYKLKKKWSLAGEITVTST